MREVSEEDTCPRCQKCDRWRSAPEHIRDPWLLWDRFPCPPPGTHNRARLLLELDWTGQLGQRDGCKALRRVATRCKVDLTEIELSESLSDCDELFTVFGLCGTQCVIAIILACICLLFVFLLVIVCCRYVRRPEKGSESPSTKTVHTDQSSINTQVNRYYVQSQYYYRAGNIPERRGLPFEARSTENGVEARLIKAIQQNPLQGYQFDEMCSQCQRSISRQSTLSGRSRHGYERIYWRDKEGLEKSVPSHDTLTQRRASDRHRSITGSSSDMSHYYEYISDNPYDGSVGRRSNHSTLYFPRNSSSNFKDGSNYGETRSSDEERVLMLSRFINTEMEVCNSANPHREIVPYEPDCCAIYHGSIGNQNIYTGSTKDDSVYGGSLKDQSQCSRSCKDQQCCTDGAVVHKKSSRGNLNDDQRQTKCSMPRSDVPILNEQMKGYKYTYNPSYDEDTTMTSRNENEELSSSILTPSDCLEFEEISPSRDLCDSSSSLKCTKPKSKSRTPSLRSNRNSETTSLSDSSLTNSLNIPKTNGSFYKTNRSK